MKKPNACKHVSGENLKSSITRPIYLVGVRTYHQPSIYHQIMLALYLFLSPPSGSGPSLLSRVDEADEDASSRLRLPQMHVQKMGSPPDS